MDELYLFIAGAGQHDALTVSHTSLDEDFLPCPFLDGLLALALLAPDKHIDN